MTPRHSGQTDPLGPDGWDGELPKLPAELADWDALLALIPEVDAQRTAPLEPFPKRDGSGKKLHILRPANYISAVGASLSRLVHADLMSTGFHWISFVQSARAELLFDRIGRGEAGDVTLEECRLLLGALARQERFCSGTIEGAIRSGFVGVVLRRAKALLGK